MMIGHGGLTGGFVKEGGAAGIGGRRELEADRTWKREKHTDQGLFIFSRGNPSSS